MDTAIGIRFLAGHYHATPWDQHVNEASVEWPPSPWRLLRSLIAVWHLKFSDAISEAALKSLVDALASGLPSYWLPATSTAHTRQYMPTRKGRGETTTLIFDGFLCVDRSEELVIAWPAVQLEDGQRQTLSLLLSGLGYLGRAESWIEARLLDSWKGEANCEPIEGEAVGEGEEIHVSVAEPPPIYAAWRADQVEALDLDRKRLNVGERLLRATLPEDLLGALQLDTGSVRDQGWSRHPGMAEVRYRRRAVVRTRRHDPSPPGPGTTTVRLALAGKPLPRIEDAIKIGEVVRAALIRRADYVTPEDGDVPSVITGHGMGPNNCHEHAFYLPGQAEEDGSIDHVIIHAAAGLDVTSMQAVARLERIWIEEGREWAVVLDAYGAAHDFEEHPYLGEGQEWVSATPYLHPWFRKKSLDVDGQIRRECRERGLPEPDLERLDAIRVHGRERRPVHFYRFRTRGRRKAVQPDRQGSFWRLTFPEPVGGPIALGTYCHFGLGIFKRRG